MKKILAIFLLFFSIVLGANEEYMQFIEAQIEINHQINDSNITQEEIETLVLKQSRLYENALNSIMSNKESFIEYLHLYENEIFSIKKIILVNERAGHSYAVLRDEVKLKTYQVLREQNIMLKNILASLNAGSLLQYKTLLSTHVEENRIKMKELYAQDYHSYLRLPKTSKVITDTQENIEKFYALFDVNIDIIKYLYKYDNKMYSLNKYTKYNLTSFVVYLNAIPTVQSMDSVLYTYRLSVMKLIFILFLILMVYSLRKLAYAILEKNILKINFLQRHTKEILEIQKKPIDLLIIIINLNMVWYVYNSFSMDENVSRVFDMIYGFFFTYMVYKAINTFAAIKLRSVKNSNIKMKNDLINVSIKVLNSVVIGIGLLIMLFYAGVDLTAVLSGLGIGGLAVAFAAKDTISNFFGTVSILVSDVFSQGDWIEVNKQEGVVVEIGLRVTTIRTFDNALIAIPNGTVANADIKNWNKRTLGRRIKMSIGVKYDSKSQDLKNAVNQIKTMLEEHPGIATKDTIHEHMYSSMAKLVSKDDLEGVKKTLLVNLDEFAPSSIKILIYCFSKSVVWNEWLDTKEDVMHQIMEILERNSLEFAFPSLSVYNETAN